MYPAGYSSRNWSGPALFWSIMASTTRIRAALAALVLVSAMAGSASLLACACGCQIFDMGMVDMPTTFDPDRLTLQYSFMDQDQNQSGPSFASPGLNPDKQNESSFYTVDLAHQFNHSWGVAADVPYLTRRFTTDGNGTPNVMDADPDIQTQQENSLGDIRLWACTPAFPPTCPSGLNWASSSPQARSTGPTGSWTGTRPRAPGPPTC